MTGNKSPKTIATINFKGGLGKTTVTWCLADTLATYSNASVLMFDLDAQMSLTQAVGLLGSLLVLGATILADASDG